jgi:hypothetical protein
MENSRSVNYCIESIILYRACNKSHFCFQDCHQRADGGSVKPILHRDIKVLNCVYFATCNIVITT